MPGSQNLLIPDETFADGTGAGRLRVANGEVTFDDGDDSASGEARPGERLLPDSAA